jgi:hypothetical protein
MFSTTWGPGLDFTAGMTAYYRGREAHVRKLAAAAHREWQEYIELAEWYRLLAEKAALSEGLAA